MLCSLDHHYISVTQFSRDSEYHIYPKLIHSVRRYYMRLTDLTANVIDARESLRNENVAIECNSFLCWRRFMKYERIKLLKYSAKVDTCSEASRAASAPVVSCLFHVISELIIS